MTRTRPLDKHLYKNYLQKAEEFYNSMNYSYESQSWNACTSQAIHCAIAAVDALLIFEKGYRGAGEGHAEVAPLIKLLDPQDKPLEEKAKQFAQLMGLKTRAEYGEQLISESEATSARKHAERIFFYIKERISKKTANK